MSVKRQTLSSLALLWALSAGCSSDMPSEQVEQNPVAMNPMPGERDAQAPAQLPTDASAGGVDAARTDATVVDRPGDADAGRVPPDASVAADAATASDAGLAMDAAGDASVGGERTLVPHTSWTCGMPEGIPPPELGVLTFTATFSVTLARELGATQFGRRTIHELGTGTVTGPQLEASLMSGGFELFLQRENGTLEVEQILVLNAKNNAPIYLRVCGVAASASDPVRVVMDFEAPNASHAALNKAKLVGVRELSADQKRLTLRVYDVGKVAPPASSVRVDPGPGAIAQHWECATGSGQRGPEVYRETVQIGGSVAVGESKRGRRNIIPITGGSTTGRIQGKILPLGADFQILGSPFVIDARYVVLSSGGDPVIVRNCGAVGALVPTFEARAAGPYAFLNEDRWLSSDPSIGLGSVSLIIYERR